MCPKQLLFIGFTQQAQTLKAYHSHKQSITRLTEGDDDGGGGDDNDEVLLVPPSFLRPASLPPLLGFALINLKFSDVVIQQVIRLRSRTPGTRCAL